MLIAHEPSQPCCRIDTGRWFPPGWAAVKLCIDDVVRRWFGVNRRLQKDRPHKEANLSSAGESLPARDPFAGFRKISSEGQVPGGGFDQFISIELISKGTEEREHFIDFLAGWRSLEMCVDKSP